jgi:hypothetical protein
MATVLQLAAHYEKTGNAALLLKLAAYSEELLIYYLNQVPCIFAFRLADNEANKKRGRVGKNSGFRQGVRNPNFIPDGSQAKTKNANSTRYYDLGKQHWRSWKRGNIISVTAFWSVAENKFVDTPEEAGIVAGKAFKAAPKEKPTLNPERASRTAKRETQKREREKVRTRRQLRTA